MAAGAIHMSEHEAALERDASAQAEVRAMKSALRQAESNRTVAARTSGIRAAQVADGRLTSPLAGLVVARDVEAGQLVTPGTPAFTIVATDAMRVRAWVDETALGRLAVGQPVRLVFRSEGDRSFAGTVERIGREVDRQTHELLVDVTVHELPTNFAVGQRADAWIEVGRRAADASVPRGWCETECAVVDGGRVASRDASEASIVPSTSPSATMAPSSTARAVTRPDASNATRTSRALSSTPTPSTSSTMTPGSTRCPCASTGQARAVVTTAIRPTAARA